MSAHPMQGGKFPASRGAMTEAERRAQDEQRIQDNAILRELLRNPHFRCYGVRILQRCGLFAPIPADPMAAQKAAGRRAIGLSILEDLSAADPVEASKLMAEVWNVR